MDSPMHWMKKKDWNRSRAAALGLLLVTIILPILAVAMPWFSAYRSLSQRLEETGDELQRYGQVAAQLPALQAQLAALRADHDRSGYWPAGSSLTDTVKAMVERHGATLTSAQDKPGTSQEGVLQQGVRLSLMARADQLTALLHDLETHEPALFVEDVSITNRHAFSPTTKNTSGSLQVMLEVSGYQAKTP